MRPWQFGKPKNPGFGISKGYYLSILAAQAVLPAPRQIANPQKADGAVEGFAVPLSAEDKGALDRPMERGIYAIASKDQKTVLQLTVVSKEEANFDPEAFVNSSLALAVDPEIVARIRATWSLCQLTFKSHDAMVGPALDLLLGVAGRIASLSEGIVADPISRRYLLPEQVFSPRRLAEQIPIYAEEHIACQASIAAGGLTTYTLGLQKFAMPELEITGLSDSDQEAASICLLWLAQQMLLGVKVEEGYQVGGRGKMFEIRVGGLDKGLWEGVPVWELLPPTGISASDAVQAWHAQILAS